MTASAFAWQKNDDTESSTAVAVTGDFNGGLRVWDYKEAELTASGRGESENEAEGATPLISKRRRLGKDLVSFFLVALTHYAQPPNTVMWLMITSIFFQGSESEMVLLSPSVQNFTPISSFKAHTQVYMFCTHLYFVFFNSLRSTHSSAGGLSQKICGICSIPNGLVYTGSWDR